MQRATRRQLAGTGVVSLLAVAATLVLSPSVVLARLEALSTRPTVFLPLVAGLYLCRPLVLWPISLLSMAVGFGLGLTWGLPVAFGGIVLTTLPPFLVARHLRTDAGVLGTVARTAESVVDVTGAFRSIVAVRLAPSQPDVVSYAAGLSSVPTGTYVVATLVGETPWVVAAVLAGDSMRTLTTQGLHHGLEVVVAAASVAVLLLAKPLYRHLGSAGALRDR